MLENTASCHRQHIGTFHAGTHSHKNQVKAERALETFISASNAAHVKRVDSPASAILTLLHISAVLPRPGGFGITQVANKSQGSPASNAVLEHANPNPSSIHGATAPVSTATPSLHRSEGGSSRVPSWSLIPAAHASADEEIPMTGRSDEGAGTGQQIEDIGQAVAATGFCGVVRRNPVGAIIVAGGAVVTAAGLLYKHLSSTSAADSPEELPLPAALSSNSAVAINDACTNLIGQFSRLGRLNIDQLMSVDLSPIETAVNSMMNIPLEGINRADLNNVGNCVGVDLRTSKVEPLINRLVGMKRDVQEGTAISIDAPFSELRKIGILSQLNSMLNSLRRINSNLYNLTANINRRFLDYVG